MDLNKMRPIKPTEKDIAGYDMSPALEMKYSPRKIQIMDKEDQKKDIEDTPILVRKTFLDSNHHVNNGRYITEAMNFLPDSIVFKEMRVDYRKAAALGDEMYPAVYECDKCYQVVFSDKEGNPFVIVEGLW